MRFIILLCLILPSVCQGNFHNYIKNGDFEELTPKGFPKYWYVYDEARQHSKYDIKFQSDPNVVQSGSRSVSMFHKAAKYTKWVMLRQDLTGLEPGKYVITGYVRWNGKSFARPCIALHLIDKNGGLEHPLVFQIWNKETPHDWVQFRKNFRVSPSTKVVGVNIIATDGPAQVYVDNVGIYRSDDIPPSLQNIKKEEPPGIPATTGHPMQATDRTDARIRLGKVAGNWYFIDLNGNAFFDLGMNHCSYPYKNSWWDSMNKARGKLIRQQYPVVSEWQKAALGDLKKWGYSSLGAWSNIPSDSTNGNIKKWITFGFNRLKGGKYQLRGQNNQLIPIGGTSRMADPFNPEWQREAENTVRKTLTQYPDKSSIIGYFPENEISLGVVPLYGYIWQGSARKALEDWLSRRYKTIAGLNKSWSIHGKKVEYKSFAQAVAEPPELTNPDEKNFLKDMEDFEDYMVGYYVDTIIRIIRKCDPDAIISSPRLPGERLAEYKPLKHFSKFDLVSINAYGSVSYSRKQLENLKKIHKVTGRPILISEWTIGGNDKNHGGAAATQKERFKIYSTMVRQISNLPFAVGMHWQMWYSPENIGGNNFGMVDNNDKPFQDFTDAEGLLNTQSFRTTHNNHVATKDIK